MTPMENLEAYRVISLDSKEILNTDGGFTPYFAFSVTYNAALFIAGFKEGWDQRKRN
jgi:hypothetical protein